MMATEPDLGARLAEIRSCAADWRNVPTVEMLRLLLEQYDAQAARLAAVEQELAHRRPVTEAALTMHACNHGEIDTFVKAYELLLNETETLAAWLEHRDG